MSHLLDTLLPPEPAEPVPLAPSPINTEAGWRLAVEAMDETAGIPPKQSETACSN